MTHPVSQYEILYDHDVVMAMSDCDCACPTQSPHYVPLMLPADSVLIRPPDQTQIALSDAYAVAFVPSFSRVATVNMPALHLLQRFDRPQAIALLDATDQAAAIQFYALGLLQIQGASPALPPPTDELIAWLHVTNACNLRCTYCYINKSGAAMTVETAFAAIDAILEAARRYGYRRVSLKYAGGEATLNLALVERMHVYAQDCASTAGIELYGVVLSNGVGLDDTKLQRIRNLSLRLMISLDGPAAIHNQQRPRINGQESFQAVTSNIKRARNLGMPLTVSVTVTGASVPYVAEVVSWLLQHETHFVLNFYRACQAGTSLAELALQEQQMIAGLRCAYAVIEQHLPRYSLLSCLLDRTNLALPHQQTCGVGANYMVVDHLGRVAKCQMDLANPITNVWEADPLHAIRVSPTGLQSLPVDQKAGCRDCSWKYWCAGGCAQATAHASQHYDVPSPNCAIYKALYPEVIRLEGLRLLQQASRPNMRSLNH